MSKMSKWYGIMTVVVVSAVLGAAPVSAATITVNDMGDNTNDDSVVTLREALISCNTNVDLNDEVEGQRSGSYVTGGGASGDVIVFDPALHGASITLDKDDALLRDLVVTDDLTITGNAANRVTITTPGSQSPYFRILTISGTSTVVVDGIRFYRGRWPDKGTDASSVEVRRGGAIYGVDDSVLTVRDCVFEQNCASRDGAQPSGGAIYTEGDLAVEDCSFTEQSSNYGQRGTAMNLAVVGTEVDPCTVSVSGSTFQGHNQLAGYDEGRAAAFYGQYVDATISNCTMSDFDMAGNVTYFGGLISVDDGDLTVAECTLDDCISSGRMSGAGISHRWGTLTVTDTTIQNCRLEADREGKGAGIYHTDGSMVVRNSTIQGNYGQSGNNYYPHGGGIYCGVNSDLVVVDSCINSNESHNTSGGVGNRNNLGGGVYYAPGSSSYTGRFDNVTFTGNMVTGPFDPTVAREDGGGALAVASGTAILRNCTIVRNCAFHAGGGVHRDGGTVSLYNCIVAGNASSDPVRNDLSGTFNEVRNCIIGDTNDVDITTSANNIMGPDLSGNPKVGDNLTTYYSDAVTDVAVEDYAAARAHLDNVLTALKMTTAAGTTEGGDTAYHALDAASVAGNAGDDDYADGTLGGSAILYDQRGENHPRLNQTVDIGAYEFSWPKGTVISIK